MSSSTQNKSWIYNNDWPFLLFLLGAVNVKLYVKMFSVFAYFIYILYKKYPLKKPVNLNRFYLLMPLAGTVGALLHGSFQVPVYSLGYAYGIVQWLTAFFISYAIYISIMHLSAEKLKSVVLLFFIINIVLSLGDLVNMIIASKHFPYWYWEPTEYYGTSTGDHIKGIFRSNSITNAMVSTLGVVYFLYAKQMKMAMLCLLVLLLCTSNLSLALFLFTATALVIFTRNREVRKRTLQLLLLTIVIYPVLSPLNLKYVFNTVDNQIQDQKLAKRIETHDTVIVQKDTTATVAATASSPYKEKRDYFIVKLNKEVPINYADEMAYLQYFGSHNMEATSNVILYPHTIKSAMTRWYGVAPQFSPLSSYYKPAKLYAHRQTFYYLTGNWKNALFGAGIGNFSSKQAIKMTGLGLSGSYPQDYRYVSEDYLSGHLYTFLYVLSKPVGEHSTIQMPNSVYNQVAGEYGFIGIGLFVYFYLGYFFKNRKYIRAGRFMVIITLIFFAFEYWFEMMSLTVIFELLLLLDIYKTRSLETATTGNGSDAGV